MRYGKVIGFCAMGAMLSACGASANLPPLSLQEDAIQACAKAEGDAIFPIAMDILVISGDRGIASILPTERLSAEVARQINACARATAEAAVLSTPSQPIVQEDVVVPVVLPTVEVVAPPTVVQVAEPVAVVQIRNPAGECPAGASVLFGGVGYCTN